MSLRFILLGSVGGLALSIQGAPPPPVPSIPTNRPATHSAVTHKSVTTVTNASPHVATNTVLHAVPHSSPRVVTNTAPAGHPVGAAESGRSAPTTNRLRRLSPPQMPRLPAPPRPGRPSLRRAPVPTTAAGSKSKSIAPPAANLANLAPSETLPAGTITRVQAMPLEQFLQIYAYITGRIILRPGTLPNVSVTLDATEQQLTKKEAIDAMNTVLALNKITMIDVGEKFVLAVPESDANKEGAPFTTNNVENMSDLGGFVTKIVQLKYVEPSQIVSVIQGLSQNPQGIIPIDSSQTLILRDYAPNVKRMMEVIKKVDVDAESDYSLQVIPIKYGPVDDIYNTLSAVLGGGGQPSQSSTSAGGTGTRRTGMTGMMRSPYGTGMRTGYPGYGYNQPGLYTPQQAAPAQRLGSSSFNNRLKQVVSRMTGKGGQQQVQILQDAQITPDERSNSLIVFATHRDMKVLTNVVAKVDRYLAQVLIQATIMDVNLSGDLEYGVSAYLQGRTSDLTSQSSMNGGSPLTTLTNAGDGLQYLGNYRNSVSFVVHALETSGRAQVLATPSIQTSQATEASFSVGTTVPYATGSYGGGVGYAAYSTYSQLPVVTELDVTPFITPEGLVTMQIQQSVNDITGYQNLSGVGNLPITSQRQAQTTVTVRDGDTVMLGGYIHYSRSKSKSGVPILKDIPILGALFRNSTDQKSREELVVFIKPTILPTPTDAAVYAAQQKHDLPGINRLQRDMDKDVQQLRKEDHSK